jgi:hypothetical protein
MAGEPASPAAVAVVVCCPTELYHQMGLADAVFAGGVKIANLNS